MILVSPTSFKGTLSAEQAAAALASGARSACPGAEVVELSVSDGGPGLIEALRAARGGDVRSVRVRDPLGRPVDARILLVELEDGPAAVVESADACGMHLLAEAELDPLRTSSAGVGDLIEAAAGIADRVVVGLGGSATVDGGAGMAAALGWRLLDRAGQAIAPGGAGLLELERIEAPTGSARRQRGVIALADVRNPLMGPAGAAPVFGPQKGASPADVVVLEKGLRRLADIVRRDIGTDVATLAGGGAAGGLGAGSVAFLDAQLEDGAGRVLDAIGFDALLARAALLITGEGSWDAQSGMGKITGELLARASAAGVPVLLVAGSVAGSLPEHATAVAADPGAILDGNDLERIAAREVRRRASALGC